MPEAPIHDQNADYLKLLLLAWVTRAGIDAKIARNLAVRWWEQQPRTGIDPDLCVLWPPPPGFERIGSLCTWKPGHVPPRLSIEIVSENHPHKDYAAIQDRYAAMGTLELVVFDPLLAGPPRLGGPVSLQLWRRDVTGLFERVHFSNDPLYSQVLDAWFIAHGSEIWLADDRAGKHRWPTPEQVAREDAESAQQEAERAQQEAQRAQQEAHRAQQEAHRAQGRAERAQHDAERERTAREELERRVAELELRLKR